MVLRKASAKKRIAWKFIGLFVVLLALPVVLLFNSKQVRLFSEAGGFDPRLNVCGGGNVRVRLMTGPGLYRTASFNCGTGRSKSYEARWVSDSSSNLTEAEWQLKAREICGCPEQVCHMSSLSDWAGNYANEAECTQKCAKEHPGFTCNRPAVGGGKRACVRDLCKVDIITLETREKTTWSVRKPVSSKACSLSNKYDCEDGLLCEDLVEGGVHTGMKITRTRVHSPSDAIAYVYMSCKCGDPLHRRSIVSGQFHLCDQEGPANSIDMRGSNQLPVGGSVICRFDEEFCQKL